MGTKSSSALHPRFIKSVLASSVSLLRIIYSAYRSGKGQIFRLQKSIMKERYVVKKKMIMLLLCKVYFRFSSQQIRKLRRELESSQEKVANLTNQLSANVCTPPLTPPTVHTAVQQPFASLNCQKTKEIAPPVVKWRQCKSNA